PIWGLLANAAPPAAAPFKNPRRPTEFFVDFPILMLLKESTDAEVRPLASIEYGFQCMAKDSRESRRGELPTHCSLNCASAGISLAGLDSGSVLMYAWMSASCWSVRTLAEKD